ncbi:MAG: glycine--tRNA ligase subunit alpha, partial [Candidatus Cloacimonetes bacterium]|nr:glycine--tRNA ligase subunit alpha [Candidatus Cloacimonadota bacterium]
MKFQKIIQSLQEYWAEKGCDLIQPYDI